MEDVKEILKLSLDEKISLVETIWNNIESDSSVSEVPSPEWQIKDLYVG